MENCVVKVKEIYIKHPIFDDIADCTYVVLCCGDHPKRLPNVLKNIHILNPTHTVKLVYNKGFKSCPISTTVAHDLVNIQSYIFRDAIDNNYNRILYLEDDFTLKNPLSKKDYSSINKFIKENNPDVYGIGNFSFPKINYIFSSHEKVLLNFLGMAHCVFYNKNYMNKCLEYYRENAENTMTDIVTKEINNIEAYRYYKPLVYQTLPNTDNQKNGWAKTMGNFLTTISILFIKLVGLDNNLEPGYTILYMLPYIFYTLIVILVIFLCIKRK